MTWQIVIDRFQRKCLGKLWLTFIWTLKDFFKSRKVSVSRYISLQYWKHNLLSNVILIINSQMNMIQQWPSLWWAFTHLSLVPHICVSELRQHWFRSWFVAYSAPSHRLNQCWVKVNLTLETFLGTKFSEIFIKTQNFPFTKMHLKILSAQSQSFDPVGYECMASTQKKIILILVFVQQMAPFLWNWMKTRHT